MMKGRYYIPGIIGTALLAAAAGFFVRPGAVLPVEVVRPATGPAIQAVYATGIVEVGVMMPIAARAAARLAELSVDEGAEVTKGQQLAKLEDENLQSAIAELRAKEDFARKDFERRAALAQKGYETKATLDRARADWDSAKAAAARAEAEAGFMKLTAPADGRIIRRDGEIGQMLAANHPVFWLSCCAPLRVSAEVDEEDIANVKPAQEVLIRTDAFPGKIFHGKVQGITPKGDPVSRSFRVRIMLTGEVPLQIGMTVETNIILAERQNALLLPNSVFDKDKVWLVRDGRLIEQGVETGARGPDRTEILGGVTAADAVVLKPFPSLRAGDRIRTTFVSQAR